MSASPQTGERDTRRPKRSRCWCQIPLTGERLLVVSCCLTSIARDAADRFGALARYYEHPDPFEGDERGAERTRCDSGRRTRALVDELGG
ncbi:hypothetical protein B9G49_14280 [Halorubrum sp. SD683]|nr:hypothetical protein B9G49_14280 [Halorubrum sp. SD683]